MNDKEEQGTGRFAGKAVIKQTGVTLTRTREERERSVRGIKGVHLMFSKEELDTGRRSGKVVIKQ